MLLPCILATSILCCNNLSFTFCFSLKATISSSTILVCSLSNAFIRSCTFAAELDESVNNLIPTTKAANPAINKPIGFNANAKLYAYCAAVTRYVPNVVDFNTLVSVAKLSPIAITPFIPSVNAITACTFNNCFSSSLFSPPNKAIAPVAAWNPDATPLITFPNACTLPSGLNAFISAFKSPMSSLIVPNFLSVAIYFSEPVVNPSSSFCASLNSCFSDLSDFVPSPISTEALYAISIAISFNY